MVHINVPVIMLVVGKLPRTFVLRVPADSSDISIHSMRAKIDAKV